MPQHETPQPSFSAQDAAAALSGQQYEARDLAHGEATGLTVQGPTGPHQLEVFASGKAVRLSGPRFRLEAVGTFTPHVAEGRVWLTDTTDQQATTLGLRSDGSVIFHQVAGATERPQAAETPQRGSNTRLGKETPSTEPTPAAPALDETARPDEQSADRTTGEQATGKERGTVVSIAGRLGRDPVVSERDGTVRVKLTVAEHYVDTDTQEEKTRWHEVWAASGTAEAVRDQVVKKELRQGTEVRIRGYEHRREKDSKGKQQPPFIRAFKITPTRKARQG